MPSKYSVIRYVPDPLTDERINIGVVAYDDHRVAVRFVQRWNRVQHFAGRDVAFLRELARDMQDAVGEERLLAVGGGPATLHGSAVERIASKWINCVQLSEPRASLAPVDQVLNEMTALFLAEGHERLREFRDHRYARWYLKRGFKRALQERLEEAQVEALLNSNLVQGSHQVHSFDVVIGNGTTYAAGSGLSFEAPEATKKLQMAADALAWSIDDVKQRAQALPLAVVMLPPVTAATEPRRLFTDATRIYRELGADVVAPDEVKAWASRIVARLPT